MRRTVPPSAEIEEQIDELLAVGVGENPRESLSSLANSDREQLVNLILYLRRRRYGTSHGVGLLLRLCRT